MKKFLKDIRKVTLDNIIYYFVPVIGATGLVNFFINGSSGGFIVGIASVIIWSTYAFGEVENTNSKDVNETNAFGYYDSYGNFHFNEERDDL